MKLRSKAVRKGVWYDALSKTERIIVELTIKCVETVKSPILTKAISKIVGKVVTRIEKDFLDKAQEIGRGLAKLMGRLAGEWGNKNGSNWETDEGFVNFLGVVAINT